VFEIRKFYAAVLVVSILSLVVAAVGCGGNSGTETVVTKPKVVKTTPESTRPKSTTPEVPPTGLDKIMIVNRQFVPASTTVKVGEPVFWTNQDGIPHTVTATAYNGGPVPAADKLDSGDIPPGETYKHAFQQRGIYDYRCSIHPDMTGTINVL